MHSILNRLLSRGAVAAGVIGLSLVAGAGQKLIQSGQRLVFMGDSITEYGWNRSHGYPKLVLKGLKANGIDVESTAYGVGKAGETSGDMLARFDADAIGKSPAVVTISAGVNDIYKSVSYADFCANMQGMVTKAKNAGAKAVLLSPTTGGYSETPSDTLTQFAGGVRELAVAQGCAYAPTYEMFRDWIDDPDTPGLHLMNGYALRATCDACHMAPAGDRQLARATLRGLGLDAGELAKAEEAWNAAAVVPFVPYDGSANGYSVSLTAAEANAISGLSLAEAVARGAASLAANPAVEAQAGGASVVKSFDRNAGSITFKTYDQLIVVARKLGIRVDQAVQCAVLRAARTGGAATAASAPVAAVNDVLAGADYAMFDATISSVGGNASACDVTVRYGTSAGSLGGAQTVAAGETGSFVTAPVTGLGANTTYFYELTFRNNASQTKVLTGSFRTLSAGLISPSGADDTAAIQAALDAAGANGTVTLAGGVFYLGGSLKLANGVTLRGQGMTKTILHARGAQRVAELSGNARIADLTVENGKGMTVAGYSASWPIGGGLLVRGGTVSGCRVWYNSVGTANGYGAGIFISKGTIEDSTVAFNRLNGASSGGAGIGNWAASDLGAITIDRCVVTGNVNTSGKGGGIGFGYGNNEITISDTTISGNSANQDGGGLSTGGSPKVKLVDCVVTGNTAGSGSADISGNVTVVSGGGSEPAEVAGDGKLTIDSTVSDHCVLLQNANNVVKGKTAAGRTVTVTFGGKTAKATADGSGSYRVTFDPGAANATGRTLAVSDGSATKLVKDVLVGEVWLVAGQSNAFNMMDAEVMTDYKDAYPTWREQFDCPNVRVVISTPPQSIKGQDYYRASISEALRWIVCTRANEAEVKKISPLAFFFAKKLSEAKGCPVGITLAGKGGTPIGYWMTAEAYAAVKAVRGSDIPWGFGNPNLSEYLTRFDTVAARGAVWVQGETDADVGGAGNYRYSLQTLIDDWRAAAHRNDPKFPVIIASPANYVGHYETAVNNQGSPDPSVGNWEWDGKCATTRVEQELASAELLGNTAVIHAIDLSGNGPSGYARAMHPDQKPELAERAVLAARNLAYGENVAYRCPYPTEAYFNSDKTMITVRFPESVSLFKDGEYAHIPFRVKNGTRLGVGASVNPYSVTVGADGHSLDISFSGLSLGNSTTVAYCNVTGTPDYMPIYEMRIYDQNGFPLPPFDLPVANASSGGTSHTHAWGAASYTWNADNTVCTGRATCTQDASHTAVQAVSATLTVTVEPTETSEGAGIRTATFTSPFTTQSKAVTLPKVQSGPGGGDSGGGSLGVQLWANGPYWATMNVGASSETDAGKFFMWGDTTGYEAGASNPPFGVESSSVTAGKTLDQLKSAGYVDSNGNLALAYDAAYMTMGGTWRMPTYAEWEALVANCTFAWDASRRVLVVTGKGEYANAQISLPSPGYWNTTSVPPVLFNQNICSYYYSSTPVSAGNNTTQARGVTVQQSGTYAGQSLLRYSGYCVRAVSTTDPGSGGGGGDPVTPGGHTHSWGAATYAWTQSGSGYTCTATRSCTGCTEKQTAMVTATYSDSGTTRTYTAAFASPFTTQTKTVTIGGGGGGGEGGGNGHAGVRLWANGPYWATMNVGASSESESGLFFNWGGTTGYAGDSASVPFCDEAKCVTANKSLADLASGGFTVNGVLAPAYDAATVNMGGSWRMPTQAEAKALVENCDVTWTGSGLTVRGRGEYASAEIFLPCPGYFAKNGQVVALGNQKWCSYYFTSTPVENMSNGGICAALSVQVNGAYSVTSQRISGNVVRAVSTTDPGTGGGGDPVTPGGHTHSWGAATYTWTQSGSGYTCTATRSCSGCTEKQTAMVTATYSDSGTTRTYTAAFASPFTTQTKTVTIGGGGGGGGEGGGNGHAGVQLWANGPYWATMNVGASSESDVGKFFSWGATTGFEKGATTAFNGGCTTMDKSVTDLASAGYLDGNGNLKPAYDAASVNMGGSWRMPTKAEFDALFANCELEAGTVGGMKGMTVRGKGDFAGASIFLPAVGLYTSGGSYGQEAFCGYYASSTPVDNWRNDQAYGCMIQAALLQSYSGLKRDNGYAIRAVCPTDPGTGGGGGDPVVPGGDDPVTPGGDDPVVPGGDDPVNPTPAFGSADWYVSPTGSDSNAGSSAAPFATIGKAIASASAGQRICVLKGTYLVKDVNEWASDGGVVIDKAVTVFGETGNPADVIIRNDREWTDSNATWQKIFRTVKINHAGAVLSGVTVENGIIRYGTREEKAKFFGANVVIDTNGGTVTNCIIRNGRADTWGNAVGGGDPGTAGGVGGIACFSQDGLITHCVISNNTSSMGRTSTNGSKALAGGGIVHMKAGTLRQSLVAYNTVTETWCGSAVYASEAEGAVTLVENCTICGNRYMQGAKIGNYDDAGQLYPVWIPNPYTTDGSRMPEIRSCLIYGNVTHNNGRQLIDWSCYNNGQTPGASFVNCATDMTPPAGATLVTVGASDMADLIHPKEGSSAATAGIGCTWLLPGGGGNPGTDPVNPGTDPEDPGTDPGTTGSHTGTLAGHEGVQLWAGGPYWATVNGGATKVGEPGSYYYTSTDTYGYAPASGYFGKLVKNSSETLWGNGWRKPSEAEFQGLINNTTFLGVEVIDEVNCAKLCGKSEEYKDAVIYFPIVGWGNGGATGPEWNCWNVQGKYWGATASGEYMRNLLLIPGNYATKPDKWMEIVSNGAGASHGNYYSVRQVADASAVTPGGSTTHTHAWGTPSYAWTQSGTGWSCTATASCTGCSQKKTKTVAGAYSVVTPATADADGLGRYTATFTEAPFTATKTKDVVIPKTGGGGGGGGEGGGDEPIVGGGDRYVSTTGSDSASGTSPETAFKTIARAVEAAQAGQTVHVASGTFLLTDEIVVSKAIVISGEGWENTVIRQTGSRKRCMTLDNGAKLEGVTLTGGTTNGSWDNGSGAGVKVNDGTVSWCCISNNVVYGSNVQGGGVNLLKGRIDHSIIAFNKAGEGSGNGGGIGGGDGNGKPIGAVVIDTCLIYGNIAAATSNTGCGGGIGFNEWASRDVTIRNTTITGNSATKAGGGGGLKAIGSASKGTLVQNCIIWGNTADGASNDQTGTLMSASAGNLIGVNPKFVDATNGDYRLAADSPAVGVGVAYADIGEDLDDKPFAATPAAGCYEFGQPETPHEHVWSAPTYSWMQTGSGYSCTATATCACGETVVEQGTVTSAVTAEATCTTDGTRTYTATFATLGTATKTEAIPCGHDWGEVAYEWNLTAKTCTAVATCKRDTSHRQTVAGSVRFVITEDPTTVAKGKGHFVATFADAGLPTQTSEEFVVSITPIGGAEDLPEAVDEESAWDEKTRTLVVSPAEGSDDIAIANLPPDATVVVPPGVESLTGVSPSQVRVSATMETGTGPAAVDITGAFSMVETGWGVVLELNPYGSVTIGDETIPVLPAFSDADDDVKPLVVGNEVTVGVRTIPGLVYDLLRGDSPSGIETAVATAVASGTRTELKDPMTDGDGQPYRPDQAFYVVRVRKP